PHKSCGRSSAPATRAATAATLVTSPSIRRPPHQNPEPGSTGDITVIPSALPIADARRNLGVPRRAPPERRRTPDALPIANHGRIVGVRPPGGVNSRGGQRPDPWTRFLPSCDGDPTEA